MMLSSKSASYKAVIQLLNNVQDGNLTTTTLALICLNEVLTSDLQCIQAVIDRKAVKLLLNILEAEFLCVRRSQFAALRCLTKLCESQALQKEIMNLKGVKLLFNCLHISDFELMFAAIRLISNISSNPSSWALANECNGIHQLVSLLDTSQKKLTFVMQMSRTDIVLLKLSVAEFSAKSLSLLCQYEANRSTACLSDIITVCQFWIKSKHQNVIVPIIILLQQLCVLMSFRKKVNESSVIIDVLKHLHSVNMDVKQASADLILICADDQESFRYLHKQDFVSEIFQMLSNKSFHDNEALMTSISGILWKCSRTDICVRQLEKLNAVPVFVQLLDSPSVQVKAHIVGIIGMCLRSSLLREIIKKSNAVEAMVQYLQTTHIPLIVNLNEALAKGSEDVEILTVQT